MVLGGLLAAAGVAWLSEPGKEFFVFAQEAWAEARRWSWPTRKETMQTTGDRVRVRGGDGDVSVRRWTRCLAWIIKLLTGRTDG